MRRLLFSIIILFSPLISSSQLHAEDLEMVNRPVNTSGLTGILFTTSPYTLSPGSIEIGMLALSENSVRPEYTITEYPASITVGIAQNMELALRGSYFHIERDAAPKERGGGDVELSYKWNFKPQAEYSKTPAAAIIITGIAPTGNDQKVMNRVNHWGARLGFAVGTELNFEEHILGIYADAQMAIQDLSDEHLRDRYHIVNAGILVPISKHRNLQIFIEYTVVSGRDIMTVDGMDYTAVTPGLRLVGERFNLSLGIQFLHKELKEYDDSGRIIGMMSVKF